MKTLLIAIVFVMSSALAAEVTEVPFEEGKTPPQAAPGTVWCLVTKPAVFKTVTKQVLVRPESKYVEDTSAEYKWVVEKAAVEPNRTEQVKVSCVPEKVATGKGEELVACYGTKSDSARDLEVRKLVLVKPAGKKEVTVPAKYDTMTEEQLVSPAVMVWRAVSTKDCKTK